MNAKRLVPLLTAAALSSAPSSAYAQEGVDSSALSWVGAIAYVYLIADVAVSLGCTITIIGNSVVLSSDQEPRLGWPIAALATGGAAFGFGGLLLGLGFASDSPRNAGFYAFTLVPMATGLASIGMGIGTLVKRSSMRRAEREEGERWALVPIMLDTREGTAAPGLGAAFIF